MMLAFLTDQVAGHFDAAFKKAWAYCKTKKNLFEKVRQVFDLLSCMSMNVIYRFIAKDVSLIFLCWNNFRLYFFLKRESLYIYCTIY